MVEKILPFDEALATVLAQAGALGVPREIEQVSLPEATGRVLAQVLAADRDQPPFHRSTRDGYAVRALDVVAKQTLHLAGSVRAGEIWRGRPLAEGQAIEIMTGAPLPQGADAVLMVEHAAIVGAGIHMVDDRTLRAGENVVLRGAEAHAGDSLLSVGRAIGAAETAVAASCGCLTLNVFAKPKVAIVATGDELVNLDAMPEPWQIRDSNSYALAALVRSEGGSAERLPLAGDTRQAIGKRVAQGREWDLLLLSGGVSMGRYDLVKQVLAERGAEFFFTGALIQPGKPVVFGRLPKLTSPGSWTYFFGLPGNPVSTQVCFHLFVAPLLRALAGNPDLTPRFIQAHLAEEVKGGARVTRFLPAEWASQGDGATVRIVGWQGSGDIAANARGNCYAVLPAGVEQFQAGQPVRVLLR